MRPAKDDIVYLELETDGKAAFLKMRALTFQASGKENSG
jgi:hypothetical protein